MKMHMSNGDIAKTFRESKNKKKQIEILADLNECEKQNIVDILLEENQDVPQIKGVKVRKIVYDETNNSCEETESEKQYTTKTPLVLVPASVIAALNDSIDSLDNEISEIERRLYLMKTTREEISGFVNKYTA